VKKNRRQVHLSILITCAVIVLGCAQVTDSAQLIQGDSNSSTAAADLIITGGTIITMDTMLESPDAIAVRDGEILAVGSTEEIEALRGDHTESLELQGRTILPGFIDAHSHFSMAVNAMGWANLSAAPVGNVKDIADIISGLQAQAQTNKLAPGDWLIGYGYDQDTLDEGRHVTRDDIDTIFPNNPVIIIHVSFHGAVLNSKAFEAIGYDADTPTPDGGLIVRREGGSEPLGLIMETAWFPAAAAIPSVSPKQRADNIKLAQAFYASNGITTAQDGITHYREFLDYKAAAKRGDFYLDLAVLGSYAEIPQFAQEKASYAHYNGGLKLAGIKIVGDGSPQGKTAFFTKPYLTQSPSGESDWRGEPIVGPAEMDALIASVYGAGLRAFVHANADAEVDILLNSHIKYAALAGEDSRTVIIHSQFIRQDQLEDYARYGMVPAFFSNHAYYWGDVHVENLGEERAFFLSPMKSAAKLGIHFTNHSDYMVTPLDPLFTVWTAVNRLSRTGRVIGPDERISPRQALKAITLDAAWQYGEENSKGSISPGKLADLVILDGNPLTIDPVAIKNIQIMATYKKGKLVYSAPTAVP
jgi:predicted amidohydrolase YtcJ